MRSLRRAPARRLPLSINRRTTAILIGPALIAYLVFVFTPIILTVLYSFTDWKGLGGTANFIGTRNYADAWDDQAARRAMFVTVVIAVASTAVLTVVGIALAVLLNRSDRVTRIYQAIFFLPIILSPIVTGFIWRSMLSYRGTGNTLIEGIGLGPIDFLGRPSWAIGSIVAVTVWQTTGFTMVLYLAALQTIPRELYEASSIDGAKSWRAFWHVTVPLLRPAIAVNTVLLLIFFMRLYEYVEVVTGGGPAGRTQTMAYRIVQEGFRDNRFAYGSALAVILMLMVATLAITILQIARRSETDA